MMDHTDLVVEVQVQVVDARVAAHRVEGELERGGAGQQHRLQRQAQSVRRQYLGFVPQKINDGHLGRFDSESDKL